MDLLKITPENLTITTTRLQLSLMTNEDFSDFFALQANPQIMQYIGPILAEDALKLKFSDRIKPFAQQEDHWLTLKIQDKNTQQFIGSVGFKLCSISCQRAEIGYLSLPEFTGQGYITEAATALITFLFKQVAVRKIVAHCAIDNIGSWKVMEKLNMQREGLLKSDFFLNEVWYDGYAYAILNPAIST